MTTVHGPNNVNLGVPESGTGRGPWDTRFQSDKPYQMFVFLGKPGSQIYTCLGQQKDFFLLIKKSIL